MSAEQEGQEPTRRLEAHASGDATIYQSGRDQHIEHHEHYEDGVRSTRRVTADATTDECPYPTGMGSFQLKDARWFFGRDQLASELVARLDQRLQDGGGPLIVVAPSGAGKSSLLQAGLLPRLAQGSLPGSRQWPRILLTPTATPISVITAAIATAIGADISDETTPQLATDDPVVYIETLRQHRRSLHSTKHNGTSWRLVIIIDQLEELFTMCENKEERGRFLELVDQLTSRGSEGQEPLALVVYGLRADFYAQCADHPHLKAVLQDGQVLVGSMSPDELREAIIKPAKRAGLRIEPGLIDLLLRDLGVGTSDAGGYEAGRLPLLAHALRATWREPGGTLTVDAYTATGGIEHAVATSANDVFSKLDSQEQETARAVFLRLVKIGDSFDDVRRRVYRADLLGGSDENQERVSNVLKAYTEGRLLTQQRDTVEITHEVLLRAWPRLREWINADRVGIQVQQELIDASDKWQRQHRDRGTFYRGAQLAVARDWASKHYGQLDPLAREFFDASVRADRRRARLTVAAIAIVIALLSSSLIAFGYGYQQQGDALAQQRIAIARGLVGQADAVRETSSTQALRLGLAAHYLDSGSGAHASLVASLTTGSNAGSIADKAEEVAISRNGKVMASTFFADDSFGTKLWDLTNPRHPMLRATVDDSRGPFAFGPNGLFVAANPTGNTLILWDLKDPRNPHKVGKIPDGNSVSAIDLSRDGNVLVTTSYHDEGQETVLWDIDDTDHPRPTWRTLHGLGGVDFNPQNDLLLTVDYDGAVLWDTSNPSSPQEVSHLLESQGVHTFATTFSPDGRTVAIATAYDAPNIAVELWDIAEPRRPRRLGQTSAIHTNTVEVMAFSPDGRTLTSGDITGTVILWDTYDPAHPKKIGQPQTNYTSAVTLVAFVSQGLLATSVQGGVVTLWDTANQPRQLGRLKAATFSGNLRVFATVDGGKPRLWEKTALIRLDDLGQVNGYANFVLRLNYEGDGLIMDSSENSEEVDPLELWEAADWSQAQRVGQLSDFPYGRSMAWSRDGDILATTISGAENEFVLWDVSGRPRKLDHVVTDHLPLDQISALALSPDGRTLATGAGNGSPISSQQEDPKIILWDITNPSRIRELSRIPFSEVDSTFALEFSSNGHILASASLDGTVSLWDVADSQSPHRLSKLLAGPNNMLFSSSIVALSPDGKMLATTAVDGTVSLWNIADPTRPQKIGTSLFSDSSRLAMLAFSPDGNTLAADAENDTVILWDVTDVNHIVQHALEEACERVGRGFNEAEWTRYVGTEYQQTCP